MNRANRTRFDNHIGSGTTVTKRPRPPRAAQTIRIFYPQQFLGTADVPISPYYWRDLPLVWDATRNGSRVSGSLFSRFRRAIDPHELVLTDFFKSDVRYRLFIYLSDSSKAACRIRWSFLTLR